MWSALEDSENQKINFIQVGSQTFLIFVVLITHVICFAELKFALLIFEHFPKCNFEGSEKRFTQQISSYLNTIVFRVLVYYFFVKSLMKIIIIAKDL